MARPLVTSFLRMDARDLPLLNLAKPARGVLEWPAHQCSAGVFYDPEAGLRIEWTDKGDQDRSQQVELATTAPYLGGTRRWFVCPVTRARCRILYHVEGRWISRRAFRGAYPSQRISAAERRMREAHRGMAAMEAGL